MNALENPILNWKMWGLPGYTQSFLVLAATKFHVNYFKLYAHILSHCMQLYYPFVGNKDINDSTMVEKVLQLSIGINKWDKDGIYNITRTLSYGVDRHLMLQAVFFCREWKVPL